jgi:hypothetical protein
MKMAKSFTMGLYLSNTLCIKISTPKTVFASSFVNPCLLLKMAIDEMTKPLTYLMVLVNLD